MTVSRIVLAAGLLLSATGVAAAQTPTQSPGNFGTPTGPVVGGQATAPTKREPLPPALPGTRTEKSEAAPALKPPSDMPPTEALFDGINRGDIGAVRDALNRGADVSDHNILGLTPTELSVDLGRNDITFLLLSQRGAPTGSDEPHPVGAQAAGKGGPAGGKRVVASDRAGERAARAAREPQPTRGAVAVDAPLPRVGAQRPGQRQYAGDGGSPIPQAGFLGFGGAAR